MLTIREVIKTLYNALLQRLKKHRGNWDQNDPTADDYIKNRPFYTDETNKETVVKTTNFTAENSYWWGSPFACIPVVGETYKVTWDGKEYICTAYLYWDTPTIGNAAIDGEGPDTGEPFLYYWYDSYEYGMCVRYQGKHTITIEKIEVKKLDSRYLPDLGLATVATSGSYYDLEDTPTTYSDVVRYGASQSLTTAQKTQARNNMGAAATSDLATVANTGDYNDLNNKPCSKTYTYTSYRYNKTSFNGTASSVTVSSSSLAFLDQECAFTFYSMGGTSLRITDWANCQHPDHNYIWGNGYFIATQYENTGEDWYVLYNPTLQKLQWMYKNNSATDLGIQKRVATITQLNEEFIPDTIARVNNLPINEAYAQGLGKTYTWNGVTDGLSSDYTEIYPGSTYYKISDYIPTKEEMIGASFLIQTTAQVDEYVISSVDSNSTTSYTIYNMHILVDKEGIWFRKYSLNKEYNYVKSLTLNGKVIELSAPLDEQYIPSTIAHTEDIEGMATEEYVDSKFASINSKLTNGVELPSTTDGSTKRFLLTVDDQCLLTLIDQDTGEEVSVSGGIALTAAEEVGF